MGGIPSRPSTRRPSTRRPSPAQTTYAVHELIPPRSVSVRRALLNLRDDYIEQYQRSGNNDYYKLYRYIEDLLVIEER